MVDEASRVWAEDMSTAYDTYLVPAVFQPYAEDLAVRVVAHQPGTVLELAAGTGVLTRAIAAGLPGTQITATDLNVAMVDVGATQVPSATWQQADAMELPFPDTSFDLVACQFGVMFFPDRPAAYAEVARVLRPEGRFLFNSWGPLATHEVETAVLDALAEHFPDDPPSFLARVPHGYHDVERVVADVTKGGFSGLQFETLERSCRGSSADLARGYCRGTPLRAEIEARGDLDAARAAVEAGLVRAFGEQVDGRMEALVVSARR